MANEDKPPDETQAQPPDRFAGNITGIGPATEARLHDAGIRTFAQLARRSNSELFELVHDLPAMTVERLAGWDWPGRAQQLASESISGEAHSAAYKSENRQRYANFHIELLLDEENNVRRTKVRHIETKKEAKPWPGWDGRRLWDFVQDAVFHIPPRETTTKLEPLASPSLEITKAKLCTADGVSKTGIIALDQAWLVDLEWLLRDATPDMLTGKWLVRALLESTGPGQEYALPRVGPIRVRLQDYTESNNGNHRYRYRRQLPVAAGGVAQGTYEMAVVVTWEREDGTPGGLASFFNGMLQVYTRT